MERVTGGIRELMYTTHFLCSLTVLIQVVHPYGLRTSHLLVESHTNKFLTEC